MSKTPKYDAKVKAILDTTEPGERTCELTGEKWVMDEEEIGWYKKFNVPPSKRSPLARQRVMAGFMIGYQWWWQRHPETNKPVLTFVHPASGIKVLPDKEWHAADFSGIYADYDPARSFFEQLGELERRVPFQAARNLIEPENSIAVNSFGDINSYFTALNSQAENSFYCVWSHRAIESSDIHNVATVQQSHQIDDAGRIFNSRYVRDSGQIQNSAFMAFCSDCEDCFGAVSQKRKKYLWFNEQLNESEYQKRISGIDLGTRSEVLRYQERFDEMLRESVWPENMSVDAEGCVGEYLFNVRNCRYCYQCVKASRDLFFCGFTASDTHDSAYCLSAISAADSYGCVDIFDSHACLLCNSVGGSLHLEYCLQCIDCENCFGCVGLRRKKFCIFNRQFTEDDYWKQLDEIKCALLARGEYGEFFPLAMSPCYFPQSGAAMYFGATAEDGRQLGAAEYDPESLGAIGEDLIDTAKTRRSDEVPDSIDALDVDEWAGTPIMDTESKRRFAMIKPEIAHYQKLRIAPPDRHPVFRIQQMMRRANIAVFEEVRCAKCHQSLTVAKNLAFPQRTIYCEACYRAYMETR
ncbi:MAG: hypothetical protein ABIG32_00860 [Candidatus Uhrbacteria bacterium]|nr:hypothetical protein [Patescibacteria group bacterium]MBU1907114.1 hypothetical protein [Patescibacteria group bacterium]